MPSADIAPGLAAVPQAFGLTVQDPEAPRKVNGDSKVSNRTTGTNFEVETKEKPEENSDAEVKAEATEEDGEPKSLLPEDDPNVEKGSISNVKDIYGSKDDDDEWTWSDEPPENLKEAAENEQTEKYALIVRNKKSSDSRKSLEAHSIIIHSPWLKKALSDILADYPGVTCQLHRLVFEAPFKPFIHRWSDFVKYTNRTDLDSTTKEHLDLLFRTLKKEIGNEIREFEDYVLNGVVTFSSMWMIFQPGSGVISEYKGPLSAFELVDAEYIETQCGRFLSLSADCVEWDGSSFGRCTESIKIPSFSGTKKITSLDAFPLHFFENKEKLKVTLIDRGKRFEELAGHHYKSYNGHAITWDHEGNEKTIHTTGRIIVDTESFNRFSPYYARNVESFNQGDIEKLLAHKEANETRKESNGFQSADEPILLKGDKEEQVQLTPYLRMLCRSRVRGYSLKTKKWLDFFVSLVTEIEWNNHAFENLVLPDQQKETVLAFSESQLLNSAAFDDVISGKGRGVIMLLSGPPGVGKTLTAEVVSEYMHCPLHSLTSGELGSNVYEIEQTLSRTLELVARWNAVLLIDECDVFLEARAKHDLARNQIVSIFLRTLEYYEGLMFMTTNRADNIDAAFQSRIHVSLQYPDLTDVSRRSIWANFLNGSEHANELSQQDLDELCTVQLNGRQIKNVLKTAQLLALRKKKNLDRAFVETVLSIEKRRPDVATGFA
ncbi:Mitochondrial chaperone [Venturia nashicola]|nr:Mitochondrial chaperone [Venturia nashicola]